MKNKININEGMVSKKPFYVMLILILSGVLIFSVLYAVTIGSTRLLFSDVYGVIFHKLFQTGNPDVFGTGPLHDIVIFIRLPRLILAVAVGMGLAVCGVVMQAIVKNPLADPYILGVSSGASLGATVAVMLGVGAVFGSNFVGIMACMGAFTIALLVLMLSHVGGRSNSVKLLLSGMSLSAVCSAFSSFIVYFAQDKEGMMTISYWLMGSLAGAKWKDIFIVLPFIIVCVCFFMTQNRVLNLMLLGDEVAITLGTELHRYRNFYLLIASSMIGFIVYCSGMIGFVGLIIPHVVRIVVGTDHRKLIPISALLGAILLVWADVLCRVLIPKNELPIGILISMLGAPCFIYLMVRKTYGFGGGASGN